MSWLSDIANGGAQQAATAQQTGLLAGLDNALPYLNQNTATITDYGAQALQPYAQNYAGSQQGVGALGNLLGLNGPTGTQSAMTQLQTTPGYQFQLGQGDNAINASSAANGTLNSGNQLTALSNYNQGLAGNTYQSAVSNLQPYLGAANSAAGGVANVLGGEASGLTNNNNTIAQLLQGTYTGIGNAQAGADLKQGQGNQALLGGALSLGSSLFGGLTGGAGGGLSGLLGGLGGLFGGGSGGSDGMINDAAMGIF